MYKFGLKENGIDPISEIGFDTGYNDKKISFNEDKHKIETSFIIKYFF